MPHHLPWDLLNSVRGVSMDWILFTPAPLNSQHSGCRSFYQYIEWKQIWQKYVFCHRLQLFLLTIPQTPSLKNMHWDLKTYLSVDPLCHFHIGRYFWHTAFHFQTHKLPATDLQLYNVRLIYSCLCFFFCFFRADYWPTVCNIIAGFLYLSISLSIYRSIYLFISHIPYPCSVQYLVSQLLCLPNHFRTKYSVCFTATHHMLLECNITQLITVPGSNNHIEGGGAGSRNLVFLKGVRVMISTM